MGSARARPGPERDFVFGSVSSSGRFKFKLVDGSGVSCFEPDVTGCDFVFFRLEFLGGGLVVVEDIEDFPSWDGGPV